VRTDDERGELERLLDAFAISIAIRHRRAWLEHVSRVIHEAKRDPLRDVAPPGVLAYVVMALPFVHRALDAGLRAIDVRTLVEAARSCGASPVQALVTAVLPNLRGALLNASFLTLALVLGEFTVAQLLGFQPFAVWIYSVGGSQAQLSVAVSVLSLLVTWALLLALAGLGGRSRTAAAKG
jgi:putative spermidine/putrescine transport system permease protein